MDLLVLLRLGRETVFDRRFRQDVPGQQLIDLVDRMIGNAFQHMAQVGSRFSASRKERAASAGVNEYRRWSPWSKYAWASADAVVTGRDSGPRAAVDRGMGSSKPAG